MNIGSYGADKKNKRRGQDKQPKWLYAYNPIYHLATLR